MLRLALGLSLGLGLRLLHSSRLLATVGVQWLLRAHGLLDARLLVLRVELVVRGGQQGLLWLRARFCRV